MKFLIVIFALIAAAAAQLISPWGLGINGVRSGVIAGHQMGPAVVGPARYSHSYLQGSPVIAHTGVRTMHTYEPVEQHGYEIRY